jgi:DNA processing protein
MSTSESIKYLVALTRFPKIGPVRFKNLINFFESAEKIWTANFGELKQAGLEEEIITDFLEKRKSINPDAEMETMAKLGIGALAQDDEDYPKNLKEIYDPPFLLYYKGNTKCLNGFNIAIVGARKPTSYGRQVASLIAEGLAQNGIAIVSGMAFGIDAIAHETAVKNNGQTIGVLGSGIDEKSFYPKQNLRLMDEIINKNGIIISEYPAGVASLPQNFPHRNRIISGISLGTVVVEAAAKSGSLITARFALDQNREIFAVPGNIFSDVSAGPNNLIKMGAKPVSSAKDVLDALSLSQAADFKESRKIIPDTAEEKIILEHLAHDPLHIDELKRLTNLDIKTLSGVLTMMEMKGKTKNLGGMNYVRGS